MAGDEFRTAYPEELETAERKLLCCSPKWRPALAGVDPPRRHERIDRSKLAGMGLSGGGIRSATVALGVFQGLARLGLLRQIDYLSTVSGGGYFGSFFGRLFTRPYVRGIEDVEEILILPGQGSPTRGSDEEKGVKRGIFPWLRENGRYLSPNGAGDLLAGGAALFRNWVAVQAVLVTLILFLFLLAQLPRVWAEAALQHPGWWTSFYDRFHWVLPFGLKLWGSPYVLVALAVFLLWAFPLGWAYWMVRSDARRVLRVQIHPVVGLVAAALLGSAAFWLARLDETPPMLVGALTGASLALVVVAVLTLVCWWRSWALANREWQTERARRAEAAAKGEKAAANDERHEQARGQEMGGAGAAIFKSSYARHWLTTRLKVALVATGAVLLFVLVDSLGQTVYTVLLDPESSLRAWAAGLFAALLAIAGSARKLAVMFGGKEGDKRPPGWSTALATAAAFAVMLFVLTAINAASHGVAWRLEQPAYAPEDLGRSAAAPLTEVSSLMARPADGGWLIREAEEGDEEAGTTAPGPPATGGKATAERAFRMPRHLETTLWGVGVTFLFSFLFGHSWPFLNRSTHQPLYSARLVRAYLGASNPWRYKDGLRPVTEVIPGDDLHVEGYWPTVCDPRTDVWCDLGSPLHLINVTINETIDGKSQVEQRDRKGVGMAVGPGGVSAGVRHHVVFDVEAERGKQFDRVDVFPRDGFRMFRYAEDPQTNKPRFLGERMSLGLWLAISGAAFSTGVGSRTSLGLSLLTGFGNVRLGYWWNANVPPAERLGRIPLLFRGLFPVQNYLLDEFTARFPGSARRHWYLSDGGHFENMGGYELIRRRLPLIVIIDAEADPDYTFGGLSGLVRKARLDFGAEVEFLTEDELKATLEPAVLPYFGTLEMLRRGKWVEERRPNLEDPGRKRDAPDPVDPSRTSLAYASLARIFYGGNRDEPGSWLLYIKPTVRGDEPQDVLQYHGDHPEFPQQTTADQFFDEAQWESYRRLGEHIASLVFQKVPSPTAGKWSPWRFRPPGSP